MTRVCGRFAFAKVVIRAPRLDTEIVRAGCFSSHRASDFVCGERSDFLDGLLKIPKAQAEVRRRACDEKEAQSVGARNSVSYDDSDEREGTSIRVVMLFCRWFGRRIWGK